MVTYKDALEHLTLPDTVSTLHLGNLRGRESISVVMADTSSSLPRYACSTGNHGHTRHSGWLVNLVVRSLRSNSATILIPRSVTRRIKVGGQHSSLSMCSASQIGLRGAKKANATMDSSGPLAKWLNSECRQSKRSKH